MMSKAEIESAAAMYLMGYTKEKTNVYLMQSVEGGPIKIGKANNIEQRLRTHQSSHHTELRIIFAVLGCAQSFEGYFKKEYIEYRIRGEWFKEVPFLHFYNEIVIPYNQGLKGEKGSYIKEKQIMDYRTKRVFRGKEYAW